MYFNRKILSKFGTSVPSVRLTPERYVRYVGGDVVFYDALPPSNPPFSSLSLRALRDAGINVQSSASVNTGSTASRLVKESIALDFLNTLGDIPESIPVPDSSPVPDSTPTE